MQKQERGIHEIYRDDPDRADARLWARNTPDPTRRSFLRDAGYAALSRALRVALPAGAMLPAGLIPAALANTTAPFAIPGKDGLIVLNDRPINAETPAHLLADAITPANRMFVRNNGLPPLQPGSPLDWTVRIEGEACLKPATFTLRQLQSEFEHHTYQMVLECGGNGRSEFYPPASGNQWTTGAVGCPTWTGVRLADVLHRVGTSDAAIYIGYYGADTHLSGDPNKKPISRGVPIGKAFEPETLLCWAMNGQPLPPLHGSPLRLVCSGWPASTSGKWVNRIVIRDRVHDGAKMGGASYRVPCKPVAPGSVVADAEMCIIESMPVKSLLTAPRSGTTVPRGRQFVVAGHAWAGARRVRTVDISADFGATWQATSLTDPSNRFAWQHFETKLTLPIAGYYEIWARATDEQGVAQSLLVPGWNPKGYLNNACHRVAVLVT